MFSVDDMTSILIPQKGFNLYTVSMLRPASNNQTCRAVICTAECES